MIVTSNRDTAEWLAMFDDQGVGSFKKRETARVAEIPSAA